MEFIKKNCIQSDCKICISVHHSCIHGVKSEISLDIEPDTESIFLEQERIRSLKNYSVHHYFWLTDLF